MTVYERIKKMGPIELAGLLIQYRNGAFDHVINEATCEGCPYKGKAECEDIECPRGLTEGVLAWFCNDETEAESK